jgi:hypothetical protein
MPNDRCAKRSSPLRDVTRQGQARREASSGRVRAVSPRQWRGTVAPVPQARCSGDPRPSVQRGFRGHRPKHLPCMATSTGVGALDGIDEVIRPHEDWLAAVAVQRVMRLEPAQRRRVRPAAVFATQANELAVDRLVHSGYRIGGGAPSVAARPLPVSRRPSDDSFVITQPRQQVPTPETTRPARGGSRTGIRCGWWVAPDSNREPTD